MADSNEQARQQTILIVDDAAENVALMSSVLSSSYRYKGCERRRNSSSPVLDGCPSRLDPPGCHDAGHERVRGLQAVERKPENLRYPRHFHHRSIGRRGRAARPGPRGHRLHHQADQPPHPGRPVQPISGSKA